jgi:hypothetical protein
MKKEWVRDNKDKCFEENVPFFFLKQSMGNLKKQKIIPIKMIILSILSIVTTPREAAN